MGHGFLPLDHLWRQYDLNLVALLRHFRCKEIVSGLEERYCMLFNRTWLAFGSQLMASTRSKVIREKEVPENLSDWLEKWEPKINTLRRRRSSVRSYKAGTALDELEFLLARTVGSQVSE